MSKWASAVCAVRPQVIQQCRLVLQILVSFILQVTYLDALVWTHAPCRPSVKALSSTLRKAHELWDSYRSLAKSTGGCFCGLCVKGQSLFASYVAMSCLDY